MPAGVAVGIGAAAMVAAALIAAAIPASHSGWRAAVVVATVAGFAAVTLDRLALAATALIGFLISDGFLENRYGVLTWHGSSDLWRLMLLAVAGAVGLAIGEAWRFVRDARNGRNISIKEEEHGA